MVFRVCSVGGIIYGQIPDLSASSPSRNSGGNQSNQAELVVAYNSPRSESDEEVELEEIRSQRLGGLGTEATGVVGSMLEDGLQSGTVNQRPGSIKSSDIEFDDPTIFNHIGNGTTALLQQCTIILTRHYGQTITPTVSLCGSSSL